MNQQLHLPLSWEQLEFSMVRDASSIEAEWKALAQYAHGPYTGYAWCESWYRAALAHKSAKPVIVVGRRKTGEVDMILPLCVERRGGLRLVSRPARGISGDFGGIFAPKLRESLKGADLRRFWKKVFKVVPADLLVVNGVTSDELERGTPLSGLHQVKSPIEGFHTILTGDWQTQYETMFSSKIRRNDRRCIRRMQEEGEVSYEVIEGAQAQTEALRIMIAQKIEQLEAADMHHHYDDPTVKTFFEGLAESMAGSEDEEFLIIALKFNGETIAQNFGVRKGHCHFGLMTAMNADMRKYSPGRLLMLETSRILTERGCTFYDFGNGDYQYKQYWCTGKRERYTMFAPTSLLGRAIFPAIKLGLRLRAIAQERSTQKPNQTSGKT